jgi:DNA-directed RNA polymerase specialized sigma24 family protein
MRVHRDGRGEVSDDFDEFCAREFPRLVGALALWCGDRRVAMNLARSRFRRWQAERRARARQGHESTVHVDPDSADAVAVRRAVAALPEAQRYVLVGRYYLDLSIAETAEMLGRTPSAVTSLTHRAVTALRDVLGEDVIAREAAP